MELQEFRDRYQRTSERSQNPDPRKVELSDTDYILIEAILTLIWRLGIK